MEKTAIGFPLGPTTERLTFSTLKMIVNQRGLIAYTIEHKNCGGLVSRKPFLPGFYACPKCNSLIHRNNVREIPVPVPS